MDGVQTSSLECIFRDMWGQMPFRHTTTPIRVSSVVGDKIRHTELSCLIISRVAVYIPVFPNVMTHLYVIESSISTWNRTLVTHVQGALTLLVAPLEGACGDWCLILWACGVQRKQRVPVVDWASLVCLFLLLAARLSPPFLFFLHRSSRSSSRGTTRDGRKETTPGVPWFQRERL